MSDNPFSLTNISADTSLPPSEGNPFSLDAIERDRGQDLRNKLRGAVSVNPDEAAEADKLAKRYPAPQDVLARNLTDVRLQAAVDAADEQLRTSPKLAQALRDKTWLAQQAHDDLPTLSSLEKTIAKRADRTLLGTGGDILVTATKGAVGLPQSFVGLADIFVNAPGMPTSTVGNALKALGITSDGRVSVGKAVESSGIRFEDTQAFLDTLYSPAQQQSNEAVAEAKGFLDTLGAMLENPSTIATTVGESAPQMLGGAGVGRALVGAAPKIAPWLAAAFGEGVMGAGSAAEQTRQETEDGVLSAKQTFAAVMSGTGTALFGTAGGRVARRLGLADIDTALVARGVDEASAKTLRTGFATAIAKAGVSEGVFEELPQSVQEQMWQNWAMDRPLGQGVGKAAAQGLLAGLTMGGGFQAVTEAGQRIDAVVAERNASVQQAQDAGQDLQTAMQAASQSKLRERNPETFKQLVQQMVEETEGAPTSIFIDASVLAQSGVNVAEAFPSAAEQIDAALASNGMVEIALSEVLTAVPGTPLEQVFLQNARASQTALSMVEAQQASEQAEAFIQQEAARITQQAADQQAWAADAETVKTTLLDQLNTAGRFTPDVNEAYATLVRDFYSVMAGRIGVTPQEMYQRYPLRVGAGGQQGAVLDQGATLADVRAQWDGAGLKHSIIESNGRLVLSQIVVPQDQRSTGKGTAAMQALVAYADRTGQRIELTPSSDFGGSKKRLTEFYKRFGFVENKGRNKDYEISEAMYRPAQQLNQSPAFDGPETGSTPIGDATTIDVDGVQRPTTNSNGQAIHPTQEGVRNFWRWFGDSRVVDAEGKPLVVYHGTNAEFTEFDFGRIGQQGRAEGAGFYFTTNRDVASGYGPPMEVYLAVQKPLAYAAKGFKPAVLQKLVKRVAEREAEAEGTEIGDGFLSNFGDVYSDGLTSVTKEAARLIAADETALDQLSGVVGSGVNPEHVNRAAIEVTGFDGVVADGFSNAGGDVDNRIFVAFTPTQIKSATGNTGAFDPQNPSILNQQSRGTFSPSQMLITLGEASDLSTFLHESGHFFLEAMADLASQPDAPAEMQDDMGKLLAWFGVTGGESLLATKPVSITLQKGSTSADVDSTLAALPPAPRGSVRLFRASSPTVKFGDVFDADKLGSNATDRPGEFFTDDFKYADYYRTSYGNDASIEYVDLPEVEARRAHLGGNEFVLERSRSASPSEVWNAMTLDQKRPHHERFAESFEQYLLEGKAPSQELQPLFRRFRSWLVNVYKSLSQFMRGRDLQLNDEVRQVFDRMLATDEQIAQAEEAARLLPEFNSTDEAVEKLQARSLRDLKWTVNARSKAIKALQKEAATLRKTVEAEVRAEVEATPVYAAQRWLRKGSMIGPNGEQIKAEKGFRLNTQALAEMYPDSALSRPDLTKLKGMTSKDGLHPDLVAEMFGFATGDLLVREIADAEPMASVIEGMTDQRMLERHGDLATPEAVEQAATEAVHNEARARSLATELKAQTDMLNARTDTGNVSKSGSKITVNALQRAAKTFAQNLADRTRVRDLKSAAGRHRAAEAKAGKHWQEATAKAQTQEAVQAKRDQVLNNAAVKALNEAQAEAKKVVEFFRRVTKGNDEKTVDRGRDPDVVNAARAILAAYGVTTATTKTAAEYMDVVRRNDPAMYAALEPSVQGALQAAKPLSDMTLEELRGLNDEIRSMWHLAKRSRQMEVDGNLLDIEDAAQDLVGRMLQIGVPTSVPGEKGAITTAEEAGIKLKFFRAFLTRVEQWTERLDGKYGGPFLRLVFQPIKDAADSYRTERAEYRKKFTTLLEGIAPALKRGPIEAPELGYTFGNARDSGGAELLHAILHSGNDSNKRKLLLGRQWATENPDGTLDTSRWDAFVERMHNEGVLTKAHWDFAQGVWDLLEEMKPGAQKAHREVFGRYFAEVTANEVTTPFGTYRGGYVPAQTDTRIVNDQRLRELAEGENESLAYAFPAAPSGFTKARTEYNKPLLLDLRALAQHMDKVLLFTNMQPAVNDVRRLLTRKDVSYALNRVDPGIYEGMLIPWLGRAAKQVVETPVMGDRGVSRILSHMRASAGMALMFANVSNTVQQITGFTTAGIKVKPTLMLSSVASFTASPKKFKRAVAEASPYMRDRMLNEISAMNDVAERVMLDPNLLERSQEWTRRHAYFLQTAVDNTMSPIIWTAAYNQATTEGMNDRDAVRFADGVIRQTQGSTLPEDVSRFETGPAYARVFTQFVGYFNMLANTNATAFKQVVDAVGVRRGAGRLLYVALMGLLVPIWVAESIALGFKGGPDDEDKDGEYLDDWLASVFGFGTVKGLVALVPGVAQLGQLTLNRFNDNPADDKFSLSPAVSLIESSVAAPFSVYKAIADNGSAQKAIRDTAAAATMLTGLPFYAAARPGGYAAGVAQGRIEPTSPADAVRGAITGTASADSKQP